VTFPSRHAPIDQRLDALADLLQQLPIEFDGVALNKTIVNDLRDAALILRTHRNCPRPEQTTAERVRFIGAANAQTVRQGT